MRIWRPPRNTHFPQSLRSVPSLAGHHGAKLGEEPAHGTIPGMATLGERTGGTASLWMVPV